MLVSSANWTPGVANNKKGRKEEKKEEGEGGREGGNQKADMVETPGRV